MITKIVEWQSENWKQRIQTAWTFVRASYRMVKSGNAEIKIEFKNYNEWSEWMGK